MSIGNIVAGAVVLALIALALWGVYRSRKKGGCAGCDCQCSCGDKSTGCPGAQQK